MMRAASYQQQDDARDVDVTKQQAEQNNAASQELIQPVQQQQRHETQY
jgi:hypothetical protein